MNVEILSRVEGAVARYAEAAQVSPDEAVARLIERGLSLDGLAGCKRDRPPSDKVTPESVVGMFADDPDFLPAIEAVVAGRGERYGKRS